MPRLPGVNHRAAIRAFEKAGFVIDRRGKYVVMTDGHRTIDLPRQNPINAFTMADIIRDAGLSIDAFRALL